MENEVEVGQILLGKYRVESILGQGGMGIVVAAQHLDLGKRFAIKKLLPQAMQYPDSCERFLREAKRAARLSGEHIAQVTDTGVLEDGTPYIVMEYLDGVDLKRLVVDHGPLPPREAAYYVYQACEAVAEAHRLGIAHRDLKPANMMLIRRPNGSGCIKVLDFGISKELDPAARMYDLTRSGVIMCSPAYMAPEQVSLPKEVDLRSDIWALGVVLYELVTGILPFHADSGMELLAKILQLRPQSPVEIVPGLSGELEGIILKCLDKDRDKRFQTVIELMEALWPFVSVEQIPEPSRRMPVSDIEVTFPEFFDQSEDSISETQTRELPRKGVGGTVKMAEDSVPDAPTRALTRKIPLVKTIKMSEPTERDTQTIVVSDKRRDDSGPLTTPEAEDDVEFKIPTRSKGATIVVGLVLSAAIILVGAAVRARQAGVATEKPAETQTATREAAPPAATTTSPTQEPLPAVSTAMVPSEPPKEAHAPKEATIGAGPEKHGTTTTTASPTITGPAASSSAGARLTASEKETPPKTGTADGTGTAPGSTTDSGDDGYGEIKSASTPSAAPAPPPPAPTNPSTGILPP